MNKTILYFAKRALSDVLEGVASKNYSEGKLREPYFSTVCLSNRAILANTLLPIEADM